MDVFHMIKPDKCVPLGALSDGRSILGIWGFIQLVDHSTTLFSCSSAKPITAIYVFFKSLNYYLFNAQPMSLGLKLCSISFGKHSSSSSRLHVPKNPSVKIHLTLLPHTSQPQGAFTISLQSQAFKISFSIVPQQVTRSVCCCSKYSCM